MTGRPCAVILGNGPSVAGLMPGRLRPEDRIIRVNSFFAERVLHAGPRVDLAFIGGDPRAAPFVAAGLGRARGYRVAAWATDDRRIVRSCERLVAAPRRAVPALPAALARDIAREIGHDIALPTSARGPGPTSGVRAVLAAIAMGETEILIAGLDLYALPDRYAFSPGPRMRALMGGDYARSWPDPAQHLPDLDRQILARVAACPGLSLRLAAPTPALSGVLDLAPDRGGPASPCTGDNPGPCDWPAWAGARPLAGVVIARRLRAWHRRHAA